MFERQTKLEKVFRRHPGAPLFARLAEQALRKDRLMQAQVLCEEGCERFPDYPTGHVILGRVYETQSLWEDARAAYDTGLRLDPDQPAVYRRLAKIYRHLGNPTLALKCLESAARLDPLSESVSRQLKELAVTTRQLEAVAAQSPTTPVAPQPVEEAPVDEVSVGGVSNGEVPVASPAAVPSAAPIEEPDGPPDTPEETPVGASDAPEVKVDAPRAGRVAEDVPTDVPTDVTEETAVAPDPAEPFSAVQSLPEWESRPVGEMQPTTDVPPPVTEAAADETPADSAEPGFTEELGFPEEPGFPEAGQEADAVDLEWMAAGLEPTGIEPVAPGLPPEPQNDFRDTEVDNSEVAALGEGLFEEGDLEEPASGDAVTPTAPQHRPAASRNDVVESRPEAGDGDGQPTGQALPPATPPEAPAATEAQVPVRRDESTPAPDRAGASDQETTDRAGADGEPDEEQVEEVAATPLDPAATPLGLGSEEPSTGFALRTDDGLRDLVAEIQGPDAAVIGQDETEEEEPFATITLAQLYDRQGFGDRAARIYKQILAADPNNEAASSGLKNLSATD